MSRLKLALIAALAAMSVASPAFAQFPTVGEHIGNAFPNHYDAATRKQVSGWLDQVPVIIHERAARSTRQQVYARSTRQQLYLYAPSGR